MLPGNRSSGCCAPAGVSAPGASTGPLSARSRMRSGGDWARTGRPQSKTLRLSQSNLPAPWNELREFPPNNFLHESYIVGYTSTIIPPSLSLSVKLDCIDGNLLAFAQIPVPRSLDCRLRLWVLDCVALPDTSQKRASRRSRSPEADFEGARGTCPISALILKVWPHNPYSFP
jgi:hypothetical protein